MIGSLFLHESEVNEIMIVIRAIYEALVIVSFLKLIEAYVCYTEEEGMVMEKLYSFLMEKGTLNHAFPLHFVLKPIKTTEYSF
jgi:hypothetical protein